MPAIAADIKRPEEMSTAELWALIAETDARVRDLDRSMARVPSDSIAWAAMNQGRPDILRFRRSIDDLLASRGA